MIKKLLGLPGILGLVTTVSFCPELFANDRVEYIAQVPVAPPSQQNEKVPEPINPPEINISPSAPSPKQIPADPNQQITIKGIAIKGETAAFSKEELENFALSTLLGEKPNQKPLEELQNLLQSQPKTITLEELLSLEAALTQKYTDAGYINSGAIVPVQELGSGTVTIEVVEGTIEGGSNGIVIKGDYRLNPGYIRSRLARSLQPLNRNKLLEALQLLQLEDRIIDRITAELSAGSTPQQSVLTLTIQEKDPFQASIILDNGRTPSVGSFRRGVNLSYANLSGLGDTLSATYFNTDGSNAYDFSYSVPLNSLNGTLTLAYSKTETTVIEPPFDQLSILGDSPSYRIEFRQPIIRRPTEELALGVIGSLQDSQTTLDGDPFQLSTGADAQGRTRISTIRFFQDYLTRNAIEVFAARSQLSFGTGLFGATINASPPDSHFFAWRGSAQYVRQFAPDTLFFVRGDIQVADRPLVPLEQFAAGGLRSVRGFRQDTFLTDNGVYLAVEAQLPVIRFAADSVVQLVPFADFSRSWNSGGVSDNRFGTLASVGMGIQFRLTDRFRARLDVGIPLVSQDTGGRSLPTNNLFFTVEYRIF